MRRPGLLRPHTGGHTSRRPLGWPTDLDIVAARRVVARFTVLNPVDPAPNVPYAVLVLLYEQQHKAAVVLSAALDRELAREPAR